MMFRFSKILIRVGLFFFLVFSGTAGAQPKAKSSGFLSLSEAIHIAIAHNPSINEVQALVDISTERIAQAKSGFMPQIDVYGVYDHTTNPAGVFATKLNQGMIAQVDFNEFLVDDKISLHLPPSPPSRNNKNSQSIKRGRCG